MLIFDRSFGAHANEMLQEPLHATGRDTAGTSFRVELHLKLATSTLGAFYESPRVVIRIDLVVSGELVDAREREERWDAPWVWSRPQAGLEALQKVLRDAQLEVQRVTEALAARTLEVEATELFGQPRTSLVADIQEDVAEILWDLFEIRGLPRSGRGPETCAPYLETARTIVLERSSSRIPFEEIQNYVASPWLSFGSGSEEFADARTHSGERIVVLGERTSPFALPMLLPSGGTIFQEDPLALPDPFSRVVVWQPDEYGDSAAQMFRSSTVTRTVWFAGTMDNALAAFFAGALPDPKPRMPMDAFLHLGLLEGWWTERAVQPPIVRELGGRFAFAKLLRSDLSDDEILAAVDALVALGATVDGPAQPKHVSDDGTPIEVALIEAAKRSERAFRHLLQHSRDSEARAVIHPKLLDHPSAFVREGAWI